MGKSYRRHHKRPKRKNTRRRRRGGADGDAPKTSYSMSDMSKHLNKAYESGVKAAQPHVDSMNKMATDLHKQSYDTAKKTYEQGYSTGKTAYKGFKYSSPSNFAIAKTGEKAYATTSKAVQPHYENMKSMGSSMGSSMGFSSLSTKKPDIKELEHADEASKRGVPSAYSQTAEASVL